MIIWEFILSKLKNGKDVMLMIVIDNTGSSPGRRGFKMAVSEDGEMSGSVGGGTMEFKLAEIAKEHLVLKDGIFIKNQIHNSLENPDSSGMICSGKQSIAFIPLDHNSMQLVSDIADENKGELIFSHNGLVYNREGSSPEQFITNIIDSNNWKFVERIGFRESLYIFGGGHVSLALSKLFRELGFYICLYDDRDRDLSTFKNNHFANSKEIINYQSSANYVPDGDNIYVVIMTFGHESDCVVLKHLLNKEVKYLGMMGSKKKVSSIFEELRSQGISDEKLSRIDAPIGLAIKSETPTEIAISIAAKIIDEKNSNH